MEKIGFTGVVTASGWDDDGSILSISLHTDGEEEIAILMDDQGQRLRGNCKNLVRVQAIRLNQEDGDWRDKIKVLSFEILKQFNQ